MMDTKRPGALAQAHRSAGSKIHSGISAPANTRAEDQQQDDRDFAIPRAFTRIVIGRRHSFIYVENCPLCGLEHAHGLFEFHGPYSDPLQAYRSGGYRHAHCNAQGLGRIARNIGGQWFTVERSPPPEYHEPQGYSYQLVLGPKPACFTPRGPGVKPLGKPWRAWLNKACRPRLRS
jgi:hypothetical protein